jgi:hypothetical protein
VLAGRLPRHPVGWLLLAVGLSVTGSGVADGYARYGLVARLGALPAARWVAIYSPATILVGLALLPLATGAAILRDRLYDLDRIIGRTLAYGLLTVLLGGGYALVVLGLGQLIGRDSSLVVAAATLAVAAASSRPAAASMPPWTAASTGAATTPPRPSPPSATGYASRSTWTRCAPSWSPWSVRRCSRPACRCGSDPPVHPRCPPRPGPGDAPGSAQLGGEALAGADGRDAEQVGDGGAEVGEGGAVGEAATGGAAGAEGDQGGELAGVVGARGGGVAAVVGGEEQPVVVAKGGHDLGEAGVE